jgi:tryptophan 2,3-dioxygenase
MAGEHPEPALSFWLQLMLAEIAAKREALERARIEEALRNEERAARCADSRGGASQS